MIKVNPELTDFWNNCHLSPESHDPDDLGYYVSDCSGIELWRSLGIDALVKQGAVVLEVGIGRGSDIKCLVNSGCVVDILDISPVALMNYKTLYRNGYLARDVTTLPWFHYDLAISHLVAQHMSHSDLAKQIRYVCYGLKKDGIFALQFATSKVGNGDTEDSIEAQGAGGVCRSLDMMERIIRVAGAEIVWSKMIQEHEHCYWNCVHLRSKKP